VPSLSPSHHRDQSSPTSVSSSSSSSSVNLRTPAERSLPSEAFRKSRRYIRYIQSHRSDRGYCMCIFFHRYSSVPTCIYTVYTYLWICLPNYVIAGAACSDIIVLRHTIVVDN